MTVSGCGSVFVRVCGCVLYSTHRDIELWALKILVASETGDYIGSKYLFWKIDKINWNCRFGLCRMVSCQVSAAQIAQIQRLELY